MKVGLLQEGEFLPGQTVAQRYEEMIREVEKADQCGFYSWGTSEQHFSPPRFSIAAPEVLYAAIARHTKNIKLRIMCAVMLKWNHPILVAERLATLDIVSGGRAEIATARSNNTTTLDAFGVAANETRAQWADSMALLAKIFNDDIVEHDGPFWKVPPREIVPRCVQVPHPPVSVAAASIESHKMAGELGIGVIGFENYFGFEYLQKCIDAYREGQKNQKPMFKRTTNSIGMYAASAFCAPTREEAIRVAKDAALGYFGFVLDIYGPLGKRESYEYLDENVRKLFKHKDDLDYLMNETASVIIGSPEDVVRHLKKLEAMGIDEILLRIDGVPHEEIMKCFDLMGKEVIPQVQTA